MIIDLHVSARTGKGEQRNPREVLDAARKQGLDGLLVVARPGGVDRAAWRDARREDDPLVFFGEEVRTARGRFLCVPRDANVDLLPASWAGERAPVSETELLAYLRQKRTAIIAAQPYDRTTPGAPADLVFSFDGIHAVEVLTADIEPLAADLALEAGLGMRLPCVAGSGDRAEDEGVVGLATLFVRPIEDQEGLAEHLVRGDAWAVELERIQGTDESEQSRSRRRRPRRRRGRGPGEGESPAE